MTLPASRYTEREQLERFQGELRSRLLALPGVREAGSVQILPLSGGLSRVDFTVEGSPPAREEDVPSVDYRMVSPGYVRAAGIPLLAGRELSEGDRSDAPPVGLVNRRLAERFFPGRSAVGARLLVGDGFTSPRPVEIVGVVGDVRDAGLDSEPGVTLYIPLPQVPKGVMVYARNMFWVVRTSGDPEPSKRRRSRPCTRRTGCCRRPRSRPWTRRCRDRSPRGASTCCWWTSSPRRRSSSRRSASTR